MFRLFGVLDGHLADNEYLAGDYSIADIANWAWARTYGGSGLTIDAYPNLQRWLDVIEDRPAVQRGVSIPSRDNYELSIVNSDQAEEFSKQALNIIETGEKNSE